MEPQNGPMPAYVNDLRISELQKLWIVHSQHF